MEIFMVNSTIVNFSNSGDKEIQLATPHHPLTHSTYQLFSLEFYSEDWRSSCKLTIHQKMGGTPLSSTIFWAGALADAWRMWHGHWSLCGKTNEIKQPTLRVQIKHPNVQKKKIIQILNISGRGVQSFFTIFIAKRHPTSWLNCAKDPCTLRQFGWGAIGHLSGLSWDAAMSPLLMVTSLRAVTPGGEQWAPYD